jgi:hypothetical protein
MDSQTCAERIGDSQRRGGRVGTVTQAELAQVAAVSDGRS